MDDRQPQGHPIVSGVVALVAVCVVVGGILGGGALAATKLLGLDTSGGTGTAQPTSSDTLYLPRPTKTDSSSYLTIAPESSGAPSASVSPSGSPSAPPAKAPLINLTAAETQVAPMQQIDLSGTYARGEGAVLQVQQFAGGSWGDFPVTVSVSNGQFNTYIQTGALGRNRFRVVDTDTGKMSNEVTVVIKG